MPDDAPRAASGLVETELVRGIARAELIVAGTVVDVRPVDGVSAISGGEARSPGDRVHEATVRVARWLYGDRSRGDVGDDVRVFFAVSGAPTTQPSLTLTAGETALLMLRGADRGAGYVPAVSDGAALRTLPNLAPPPSGATKEDAVAHELEQIVLHAPVTDIALIVQAVTARVTLRHAIDDVDANPLRTAALQDPVKRAAWIAIALSEGHVDALSAVGDLPVAAFTTPPKDALWQLVVWQVSEQRAATARPALAALLSSPHVELARAAAIATRRLRAPAATPDLMRALDHADQTVRYQALMGLSELYPDVQAGPSFERYRAAESDYLDRWRRWWAARGAP